ncbi:acetyl-CoA carboxylase biotin carboxyl carrier protein subunit [Pseudomonas amygdali pv. morsprunorum]|nr:MULTISPECIES: acetyl-CoA carboxylase biotin carboxyl carrier protein subunit [Pseudomonas syringae group genomosp. 2]KPC57773.1 Acetyl-CoA carboxylase [Pseudomonas amygdali pv. morsprunorum]PPS25671.1 acetyl-CoA carboxylase biotin carboxyl carrier protein subunit [Pseudomonas amygdali pv. morsprunorum]PPS34602.1 acetyl-CoA carboxylase biotin carboxyl carrier protein subunit [Pseudomonas amygdali pv. morsprunorum]PPS36215.1 acetyl-CoA carboxylase biotin carboxyl carrier protein subunit [Pseud
MKPERIKALIDLMAESDLSELSLSEGDTQLRLLRESVEAASGVSPSASTSLKAPATDAASSQASATANAQEAQACASLYGVLHLTPAPDQPPFVEVGTSVEVGQTLAVVEAMKMFHPVTAEKAGVVTAILVANGEEVQAGQALFSIG